MELQVGASVYLRGGKPQADTVAFRRCWETLDMLRKCWERGWCLMCLSVLSHGWGRFAPWGLCLLCLVCPWREVLMRARGEPFGPSCWILDPWWLGLNSAPVYPWQSLDCSSGWGLGPWGCLDSRKCQLPGRAAQIPAVDGVDLGISTARSSLHVGSFQEYGTEPPSTGPCV